MSLAYFHVLLISVAAIFGARFGYWEWKAYQRSGDSAELVMAVFSLVVAAALIFYVVWFLKKIKPMMDQDNE